MSAAVESMVYFSQKPWHNLGVEAGQDDIYDIPKFLEKSGTDWEVRLDDLFTADGRKAEAKNVTRVTDNASLGVVGMRYHPLQNRKAFEWFQPFLDTKACALHTAGSLLGGKKVWVLAQINSPNSEIVKGDEVAKFVMLSNSHDGTSAVRVGTTGIRIVCCNTLAMAHNSASSKLIRLRHSTKVNENLEAVRDIMNLVNQEFEATAEQYRFLTTKAVNQSDLRKYVKILEGIENVEEKDISTRQQNIMDDIILRCVYGVGSQIAGVGGTWWAAYNGYAEYLSWKSGRNNNHRLNSLWFGQGSSLNTQALNLATKMAG